jgi:hypothetical protein
MMTKRRIDGSKHIYQNGLRRLSGGGASGPPHAPESVTGQEFYCAFEPRDPRRLLRQPAKVRLGSPDLLTEKVALNCGPDLTRTSWREWCVCGHSRHEMAVNTCIYSTCIVCAASAQACAEVRDGCASGRIGPTNDVAPQNKGGDWWNWGAVATVLRQKRSSLQVDGRLVDAGCPTSQFLA